MNILDEEIMIKFKEKLREMVPEVIEDLADDRDFMSIADNMVYILVGVINDEYHKQRPGAPTLYYELC